MANQEERNNGQAQQVENSPPTPPEEQRNELYPAAPAMQAAPGAVQNMAPAAQAAAPNDAMAALGLQRKKRGRRTVVVLIILAAVVALIVFFVARSALRGPDPTFVELHPVATGDISQGLSTSGVLTTGQKMTVFSTASAPISAMNVEAGQIVNEGDMLFTFDTKDLERSYNQAAAGANLASLQAQSSLDASNKSQQTANDAAGAIGQLAGQRDAMQEQLNELSARVGNIESQYAAQGVNLTAMENELELLKVDYAANPTPELKAQITALASQLGNLQAPLQQATAALAGAQEEVVRLQGEIAQLEGTKEAAEALELARQGVKAPLTGVVSSLSAEAGSLASQYTPLCVIESLDKVNVVVALSRYDLERVQVGQSAIITSLGKEYTGTVSKIDATANLNMAAAGAGESGGTTGAVSGGSSFVNATISVTKPDRELILGLEANVQITTGAATGVVIAPIGAINTDVEGTYCYVAENGVAVRRDVTLGLSGDTEVEILEGLQEGDQLILASQNLLPGMLVSDDPAYQSVQDLMSAMMG